MKIRLTKPLPQPEYGRVIPAGVVIDAPPALSARLLRRGMGLPLPRGETRERAAETPETADDKTPETKQSGEKPGRKKVKRDG